MFATAGTPEKRNFIHEQFGIPHDHIFSSRTSAFAQGVLDATSGYGVDIVLNSLTGDLLEASWNLVAFGGTLVEIGKRDIADGNRLPMGPFSRGASFRALDLTQFTRWGPVVERLMGQLFNLLDQGHLRPVFPLQTFPWDQVQNAFSRLGSSQVMGKLVMTAGSEPTHIVKVRPAPRAPIYRGDVCYLIVGGLKGLGGSLAVDLAKRGVKRLATLSRSGYDDYRSQINIRQIHEFGGQIDLLQGDVSNLEDVRRAFAETTVPVGGIIQAAMLAVVSTSPLPLSPNLSLSVRLQKTKTKTITDIPRTGPSPS